MTTEKPAYPKMKSWADHCSSDEESDDELHPARLATSSADNDLMGEGDLSYDESIEHISVTGDEDLAGIGADPSGRGREGGRRHQNNDQGEIPYPQPINFDEVPADFPKQAPYTAYIRNLCYKIDNPSDLADKIEGMTRWRYQKKMEVQVINARLGMDRETGKRKGFGYIEFNTPEELMIFLNLNDGFSRLNGRNIIIDIAKSTKGPRNNQNRNYNNSRGNFNDSNRSNHNAIDGSNFRGGRYAKSNTDSADATPAPPTERRSLKLAPRSKPSDDAGESRSQASIFGAAKPRDIDTWRRKKEEGSENNAQVPASDKGGEKIEKADPVAASTESGNDDVAASRGGERVAGRGGRGRGRGGDRKQNSSRGRGGRGGRGAKRDSTSRKNNDRKNNNQGGKDADGWDEAKGGPAQVAVQLPVVEPKVKNAPKVSNAFAALGFDSDSD